MVDLNGFPLAVPITTNKMIVYRVYKMRTTSSIGEDIIDYHIELVRRPELDELTG